MLDKESAYVVVGALPGFNKDEINIQVEKINQYTILSVEAKQVRDQVLTAAELSEIYRRHIGLWP